MYVESRTGRQGVFGRWVVSYDKAKASRAPPSGEKLDRHLRTALKAGNTMHLRRLFRRP